MIITFHGYNGHSHSHQGCWHSKSHDFYLIFVSFPLESHGFLVPIGNPILMVTVADRSLLQNNEYKSTIAYPRQATEARQIRSISGIDIRTPRPDYFQNLTAISVSNDTLDQFLYVSICQLFNILHVKKILSRFCVFVLSQWVANYDGPCAFLAALHFVLLLTVSTAVLLYCGK